MNCNSSEGVQKGVQKDVPSVRIEDREIPQRDLFLYVHFRFSHDEEIVKDVKHRIRA